MAQEKKVTCTVCGRYLGTIGINAQVLFAPCVVCKTQNEINVINGDIHEMLQFKFSEYARVIPTRNIKN